MKSLFLTSLFVLVNLVYGYSQMSFYEFGARSKGVGNSNSTLSDEWSIFNNVGDISGVDGSIVCFGYDRYGDIEGFDKVAAGLIHPFSFGNIGISLFRFGDNLFSEQSISAAYGNKIGFVRIGFKVNYYQMRIDEFGSAGALFFDFGGIVELIPNISFGAFISNFTMSQLDNAEQSKLPVIMKLGLTYMPINKVSLNLDVYSDIENKPIFKIGVEYLLAKKFYLRIGVNTNPIKSFYGIGVLLNRI